MPLVCHLPNHGLEEIRKYIPKTGDTFESCLTILIAEQDSNGKQPLSNFALAYSNPLRTIDCYGF